MVEHSANPKKKTRPDSSTTASENRKLRNRLSQKAFRARQSLYIKDLEKRLEWASKPESDQNAKLEETNQTLRNQLLDCHKKLESFQVTLKALADSVAYTLGIEKNPDHSGTPPSQNNDDSDDAETPPPQATAPTEWNHGNDASLRLTYFSYAEMPVSTELPLHQSKPLVPESDFSVATNVDIDNNMAQLMTRKSFNPMSIMSTSYEQMMGPMHYNGFLGNESLAVQNLEFNFQRTNSSFSDHITICENLLRLKFSKAGDAMNGNYTRLKHSTYLMLATFIYLSWPKMKSWHAYTRAHIPITKLMAWHVDPTTTAFTELNNTTAAWVPTKLQSTVPHPAIVDWVPFPGVRDKLILCHSANPCLDEIIRDLGNSYVVEADASKLVVGLASGRYYLSVWDIVRSMTPESTEDPRGEFSTDERTWNEIYKASVEINKGIGGVALLHDGRKDFSSESLPAPNVEALFSSEDTASSVFNYLKLGGAVANYKIDPSFFERHPELYDNNPNLVANGIHIRPLHRHSMTLPVSVTESVLTQYREFVSWAVQYGVQTPS
ncbi:transcription factor PAP1 protein [Rutstroemia sp. NJR-2017a WRK4]|nr:transcription factor PAP1 protein [Rutstroemia sp. NJR-2017a WRK4]